MCFSSLIIFSRLKAQGSRLKAQGSRLKAQGSRLKPVKKIEVRKLTFDKMGLHIKSQFLTRVASLI